VPDNLRERVISEVGPLRWFQVSSSSSGSGSGSGSSSGSSSSM
jgi:hypothetical protein